MARIFFRATSISDALLIVKKIFTLNTPGFLYDPVLLFYCIIAILLLMIKEIKEEFFSNSFTLLYHKKWQVRTLAAASLVILIILAGVFDGGQFIYFQF
jgi:hypothetical protein